MSGKSSTGRGYDAAGVAAMVNGNVTVSTPVVLANSVINALAVSNGTGTDGILRVSAINTGANFTISSSSSNDTCSVAWTLINGY